MRDHKIKIIPLLFLFASTILQAQQSGVVAYGAVTYSIERENRMTAIIGQPLVGDMEIKEDFSHSSSLGFWSIFKMPPLSPWVFASDGDFPDRIETTWRFDPLSPPPDGGYKIFRKGSLLGTLEPNYDAFQDFNVTAGKFYEYQLLGINEYGEGGLGSDVGFVNPNGVITGNLQTSRGSAVVDAEVYLDPVLGNSLQLDGVDDFIEFTNDSMFNLQAFTIEYWIYPTRDAEWQHIVSKHEFNYITSLNHLKPSIKVHDQSLRRITSSEAIPLNRWTHIANVYDKEIGAYKIYVNGKETASADPSSYDSLRIMKEPITIGFKRLNHQINYFKGNIDDVRIWDRGKSRAEIERDMNRTLTGAEDNLVAYWKFDEGTGNKIFDLTNNSFDGIASGGEWSNNIAEIRNSSFSDIDGNFHIPGIYYGDGQTFKVIASKKTPLGAALNLNTTDTVIVNPDSSIILKDSLTVEGWINITKEDTGSGLFYRGYNFYTTRSYTEDGVQKVDYLDTTEVPAVFLGLTGERKIKFGLNFENGDAELISGTALPTEEWIHFAAAFDGSEMKILIHDKNGNKIEDKAQPNSGEIINPESQMPPLYGHFDSKEFITLVSVDYNGYLDEFKLWSSARSLQQIEEDLNGSETKEENSLRFYFKMNENVGLLLSDHSENDNGASVKTPFGDDIRIWTKAELPFDDYFYHTFSPGSRLITLNESNTSVDNIQFSDVSQLTVTGYVKYANTSCFADTSVEILVDGKSASPEVFCNADGKFTVELSPGSNARLSPKYGNHKFNPPFYEVQNITRPIAGILFTDLTTRTLSGTVAGGTCRKSIKEEGKSIILNLISSTECFTDTASVKDDNTFTFENLPPLDYTLSITHYDPTIQEYFDKKGGIDISLRDEDKTHDFIYFSDLIVEIMDLPTVPDLCDWVIMNSGQEYTLSAEIKEEYFGGSCKVDTGFISVLGDAVEGEPAVYPFKDGVVQFTINAGQPNLVGDGKHPWQRLLQVVAEDKNGRISTDTAWVRIKGKMKLEHTFVSFKTPELPTMVLRDPPGDQSYCYIEKGFTTGTFFRFTEYIGGGEEIVTWLGTSNMISIGLGYAESFEGYFMGGPVEKISGHDYDEVGRFETKLTTERFQTNNIDGLADQDGDIFVGAAFNFTVGQTRTLEFISDSETGLCKADTTTERSIGAENIESTFIYSENHIKTALLPELKKLKKTLKPEGEEPVVSEGDEIPEEWQEYNEIVNQISLWEDVLIKNNEAEELAVQRGDRTKNISFDAGSTYDYSFLKEHGSDSTEYGYDLDLEFGVQLEGSFKFKIAGVVNGYAYFHRYYWEDSSGVYARSNEIGYHFEDDDAGDYFSVDIYDNDPVFDQPVFNMFSGQSSCPWEVGTRPRNAVELTSDSYQSESVLPNEIAVFNLSLKSLSQSDEVRPYQLRVQHESNENGATIAINGIIVEDELTYFIPAFGSKEAVMTVQKGPGKYMSDTIDVMLYSECEYYTSIPDDKLFKFKDTKTFIINYAEPCADVELFSPKDNWLLTQADLNESNELRMGITITDFDTNNPDLDYIALQYKKHTPIGGSAAVTPHWIKFNEVRKDKTFSPGVSVAPSENETVGKRKTKNPEGGIAAAANPVASKKTAVQDLMNQKINFSSNADATPELSEILGKDAKIASEGWTKIINLTAADLPSDKDYFTYEWNLGDNFLDDGYYMIRAVAFCKGDGIDGISQSSFGRVDTSAPKLVGEPSPVDGVLGRDDEIIFEFDENIDCGKIDPTEHVSLVDTRLDDKIDFSFTCAENRLAFTPLIENRFIENHTLRAEVQNIFDSESAVRTDLV